MEFAQKEKYDIKDLLQIVRLLRAPDGCPWDREQTHESIRANLIEETYEVAEAIDEADAELLCEELGDLLLQVALHVEMEEEAGRFTFGDVCDGICKKLIYRHPHVFKESNDLSTGQVLENWEKLKNKEKGRVTAANRLESVPQCLPALMKTTKVQKRADEFGFGYDGVERALQDLEAEIKELRMALQDGEGIPEEAGDVLFSAANAARLAGVDAEEVLTHSTKRFVDRVKLVETLANQDGADIKKLDEDTLDRYWKQAKNLLAEE